MKQLTVGDIETMIVQLKQKQKDYKSIPVYLGNDDELNGVHCAWCCDIVTKEDKERQFIIEMIDERAGNNKFNKIAVMLS